QTLVVGPHRLKVDLYEPDGGRRSARPAVLMVHGGGWAAGDRSELSALAHLVAQQGVVALSMDYRLSSEGAHWPAQAEDVAAILRWMRGHAGDLGIDGQRIALLGGSAGGHLAAWAARDPDPRKRPNRLIVLWGPWDLEQMPSGGPDWVRPSVDALLNGRSAREASPLHHLAEGMPPTLIVHGVEDEIVPIDQSRRACTALRRKGNVCTLVELPGQGHAPEDPKQVMRAFTAVQESLEAL
ncbi:MAG: alpha/beta hydrolase, partial [Lysobacteraceae bacterium]